MSKTKFEEGTPYKIHYSRHSKIPNYVHNVDQFMWYRCMLAKAKRDPETYTSAVRFNLPYGFKGENDDISPPTHLIVVGDGIRTDCYFVRTWETCSNGPISYSPKEDDYKRAPPLLWHIFSHEAVDGCGQIKKSELKDKDAIMLDKIPTTEICPFIKNDRYEKVANKIYYFDCPNSDTLVITSKCRKLPEKNEFILRFMPDTRDRPVKKEKKLIVKMVGGLGYYSNLLDKEPHTSNFSIPSLHYSDY
ncbi:MAG: hypothetical protein PHU12_00790 [Candidatus Aenigmarchaeota archaeon]|nr:hypothetical protein [Candidatus Aenigmarchaeota archaeon]